MTSPRRRGLAVALVAAGRLLAGCSESAQTSPGVGDPMTDVTDPETGCGPVDHPTVQVATHLVGDAEPPTAYTSVPPTSGWHTAQVPRTGVTTEPLRDPEIVAALESGIVVLAVTPDLVDETAVGDLASQFPDRLLVVPYPTDMPTDVALLTWGAVQRCDVIDRATVTSFVLEQRTSADH